MTVLAVTFKLGCRLSHGLGRRFAAALLPLLFGKNPRSHHKGATGRVRTSNWRPTASSSMPLPTWTRIPGHTTRAPPVGFELESNGFQFYAIANLDKTSLTVTQTPKNCCRDPGARPSVFEFSCTSSLVGYCRGTQRVPRQYSL